LGPLIDFYISCTEYSASNATEVDVYFVWTSLDHHVSTKHNNLLNAILKKIRYIEVAHVLVTFVIGIAGYIIYVFAPSNRTFAGKTAVDCPNIVSDNI
jgi:hypothetical protein